MKDELLEKYKESLPATRPAPYIARASAFLKWLGSREFDKENVLKWVEHLRRADFADGTILLGK